jgi:hypothetical protein
MRSPILKAYLDRFAGEVQRFFPVPKGSPVEAFSELAPRYPVFELQPLDETALRWQRLHSHHRGWTSNTSRLPEIRRHASAMDLSLSCNKSQLGFVTKSGHGCGRVW